MGFCTPEQTKRFLNMVPLMEKAIVDSGIILIKYWLEVSPEEQTRRLEGRMEDGRKTWKLTGMDLKSYNRCGRLNLISHLLSVIPYKELPREKIKLPKRPTTANPPVSRPASSR